MKKWDYFWLVILLLACVFLGFTIGRYNKFLNLDRTVRPSQNKVNEALEVITRNYVDTVDVGHLTESAVIKMLSELDPHSSYIPPAEVETANEELEGSFSGIGISFNMTTDTIFVISIISGGPAEKAGLRPFDRIITVDDSVVAGKKLPQNNVIRMLRGPKDSKVKLGVKRGNAEELAYYELTRGDIPNYSVDVAIKVSEHAGMIKIKNFARNTYGEFLQSVAKLRQQGANGLIIDLRGNPGGYLETAVLLSNEFLSKDEMIVYTQGRAYPRHTSKANGKGACKDAPVVVLIDELSGSASEIFSGAIQDNDRGTVIGRRSFGKGLVQAKFTLTDRSDVSLTIARYYTPSGRCIQKEYELGKGAEYSMDIYNRYVNGEIYSADSIHIPDSLEYKTVGGRTVYGGGGIMPDVFIPRDTTNYTSYFINLAYNSNIVYLFAMEYSDKNQERLKSFPDYKALHEYLKSQPLLSQLADFAATKGVPKRPTLMEISKSLIETYLHSYIVRNFFDNEGYYPILYQDDPALKKAIEVIENGTWKPAV